MAGASGFVGRRLCPALAGVGHDVVAMTRNPADDPLAASPSTEACKDAVVAVGAAPRSA